MYALHVKHNFNVSETDGIVASLWDLTVTLSGAAYARHPDREEQRQARRHRSSRHPHHANVWRVSPKVLNIFKMP